MHWATLKIAIFGLNRSTIPLLVRTDDLLQTSQEKNLLTRHCEGKQECEKMSLPPTFHFRPNIELISGELHRILSNLNAYSGTDPNIFWLFLSQVCSGTC